MASFMQSTWSWIDVVLIGVFLISLMIGTLRGFVKEVLSILGWPFAYLGSALVSPWLLTVLEIRTGVDALDGGIARAIAFVILLVMWGLGVWIVVKMISATPLKPVDRFLGAGFGAVRGLLLAMLLVWLVGLTPLGRGAAWQQNTSVSWLQWGLDHAKLYVADLSPSEHLMSDVATEPGVPHKSGE